MKTKNTEFIGVLIETIEVFINQILYLRDFYPQQIFKKRRIYNAPVYASIFPPLNDFLQNVLRSAKELLNDENEEKIVPELQCIELVFYMDENSVVERHIFEILDTSKKVDDVQEEFLMDFEEKIRSSLYQMPERMKVLKKLPNETKMTIRLHTTQAGHARLSNHAQFQDFPWLQENQQECSSDPPKQWYLLPLTTLPELGIRLITEVC